MKLRMLYVSAVALALVIGCGDKEPILAGNGGKAPGSSRKTVSNEDGSGSETASGSGSTPVIVIDSNSAEPVPATPDLVPVVEEPTIGEDETQAVVIDVEPIEGPSLQVKNVLLLRSSISACLDVEPNNKAIYLVGPETKIGSSADLGMTGKLKFYNGSCPTGGDIVDCLKSDLYNPAAVSGDTVAANALTAGYLQALGTVANFVAQNCNVADANSRCRCEKEDVAKSLISSCLPYLKGDDATLAAEYLQQTCETTSTAEDKINLARRIGIANLLGSIAFAVSRE